MSAKADDYYYNQLNKEQKKVYYGTAENAGFLPGTETEQ